MKQSDASAFVDDFNSQPHEEADGVAQATGDISLISTHSLTKRLTIPLFFIAVFRYFNSQPHEEADR